MALDRDMSFTLPMMRGDDVREVQQALIRAGVLSGSADGLFGPSTRDAVVEFQKRLQSVNPRIDVDGIVGRDTWSALFGTQAAVRMAESLTVAPPTSGLVAWYTALAPYLARLGNERGNPLGTGEIRWRLSELGVIRAGEVAPRRTKGKPTTAARTWSNFRTPMEKCAAAYGVPVELIIATACTESDGDPSRERREPGYVDDATTPERISIGLMQTLISTARSALGDPKCGRDDLLQAENSIRAGAAYIRGQACRGARPTNFDPPLVGIAYNAGSLRESSRNPWGLVQTDRGDGHVHADAFVEYFNDIFAVFASDPDQTPGANTPSFWTIQHKL